MTDKREILAQHICKFIESTAVGHERAIFRVFLMQSMPLDLLKKSNFDSLLALTSVHYFNSAYRSLILRNDEYITNAFDTFHNVSGHSYICLLNIVFATYWSVHRGIPREKLDVSSLENYQRSFEALIRPLLDEMKNNLKNSFSHQCQGEDISKCDPEKPMFVAKTS